MSSVTIDRSSQKSYVEMEEGMESSMPQSKNNMNLDAISSVSQMIFSGSLHSTDTAEKLNTKPTFTPFLEKNLPFDPSLESVILSKYGLTPQDMTSIRLFLGLPQNLENAQKMAKGHLLHIRKNKENRLPRSLIFVPAKDKIPAQVFVLLKTHHIEPLGEGGFKRATKALGFTFTKEGSLLGPLGEKAFLSCMAGHAAKEVEVMNLLKYQEHCLTSKSVVKYTGNVHRKMVQEKNVPKIGIILDLMDSDFAHFCASSPLKQDNKINLDGLKILRDAAEGLKEMHKLKLVHNDVTPNNIAVVNHNTGKIADFGLSNSQGKHPPVIAIFNPPEVHMNPGKKSNYNSKIDTFQFGLTLMSLMGYEKYVIEYKQTLTLCQIEGDEYLQYFSHYANEIFSRFKRENSGPFVQLISDCVNIDPKKRIESDSLVVHLDKFLNAYTLADAISSAEKNGSTISTIELKNGAKVAEHIVAPVMIALENLRRESYDALICLFTSCSGHLNNKKDYFGHFAVLQVSGLLKDDGTVPETVKNILMSACHDDGLETKLKLNNPLATENDHWCKETFNNNPTLQNLLNDLNQVGNPHEKTLSIQGWIEKIEKNLSKLKMLLAENLEKSNLSNVNQNSISNPYFITEKALNTISDVLQKNASQTNPKSETTNGKEEGENTSPKSSSDSRNESFSFEESRAPREIPKPKPIDWDHLHFPVSINSKGEFQFGVEVPINIGGYGTDAGIDIRTDTQTLKDIWTVISGNKLNPKTQKVPTTFGNYHVGWYTMGHSIFSSKGKTDYKVEIKDPDGKKHTIWVKGAFNLENKINEYINELISKKVSKEVQNFTKQFSLFIGQGQIQAAQGLLNNFWGSYQKYLSPDFNVKFQHSINEGAAKQRIESLKNAPINNIVERIKTFVHAGFVSPDAYLEQELLKKLLVERMLETSSEQQLQSIAESLTAVTKGHYVSVPDFKENQPFPDKKDFKEKGKHWQNEMRNNAIACCSRLLNAYKQVMNTVRSGQNAEEAKSKLVSQYNHELNNDLEGLGIKLKDGTNLKDWFHKHFPEIVDCINGKSSWLNQYQELSQAKPTPFLAEKEVRNLSISVNIKNYNQAAKILNNPEATLEERQKAFDARHHALKNLDKRGLDAKDLEPGADVSFVKSEITHYEQCEGSLACSEAMIEINKILKSYMETKDDKTIIKIHQMTEAERLEMRKQAELIAKTAKRDGDLYKFSQEALRHNYQILAETYGKFGGLFITNTLSEYCQKNDHKGLSTSIQLITTCFPSLLQDALILALACTQGNGQAALKNLVENSNIKKLINLKDHNNLNLFDAGWKLTTLTLPLIYDPEDKKNRSLYQNVHFVSTLFSKVQSKIQGSLSSQLLTTTPFDFFEFLVEEPGYPEQESEWTWLDKSKNVIHQSLMKIMPNFLQPGNLPENWTYYATKHLATNIGTAVGVVKAGRSITGRHANNRDITVAAMYVFSMTIKQVWMGKIEEERCLAMLHNSQFYLRKQQFSDALPSIISLQEFLKQNSSRKKQEAKFVKLELFTLEAYYTCIYQIALQHTQQQLFDQAQPYLAKLEIAVNVGLKESYAQINDLLEQKQLSSLHEKAAEVRNKLMMIELSSLALLLHLTTTQQNETTEDVSKTDEFQKINEFLISYPQIKIAEMAKDRVKLVGFVDSEKEQLEIIEKIFSISGMNVVVDELKVKEPYPEPQLSHRG